MAIQLSKLTPVNVRDVWAREDHGFTPWLLENADALGEALGLDLELTAAEHYVGDFRLDLIGKTSQDQVVIVENQLEKSDHDHLGKLLTYAGGTDPKIIIWIATKFAEPHRAAIDWINERTDEDTQFFAVEIAAVQIDNSRPAPLFNVVAKPNNWTKQVHVEKAAALSGKEMAYTVFWNRVLERVRAEHPEWTNARTGSKGGWITLPSGRSNSHFGFVFTRLGPRVELYIDNGHGEANLAEFNRFETRRAILDEKFGAPLEYEELPDRRACRISTYRPGGGDVLDDSALTEYVDWFIKTFERFRPAVLAVRALADGAE